MSNTEKRVSEGPSRQDWLAIRPIFTRLYLDENQTLNEVRKQLATQYNFVASEKAYKRRINLWQLRKNYKASEKQRLASYEAAMRFPADQMAAPSIGGQPIKWNRVYRHKRDYARTQHQTERLWETLQHLADNIALQARCHDASETFLGAVKDFWASEIALRMAQGYLENRRVNWNFISKFTSAATLLSTNTPQQSQRGWILIHQGCKALPAIISTQPMTALKLAMSLYRARWNNFVEVRAHLILLIRNVSFKILPAENPFRTVMNHVANVDFLHALLAPLLMLQFDVFCKASTATEEITTLLTGTIMDLARQGQFSAAQQRLRRAPQVLNLSGQAGLDVSYLNALIHYKMKMYEVAERECNHGLAIIDVYQTDEHTMYTKSLFHDVLGACYDAMDDENRCIQHRWLAFMVALEWFGGADSNTIVMGAVLVRCLRKRQRWSELEAATLQYPESCFMSEHHITSPASACHKLIQRKSR